MEAGGRHLFDAQVVPEAKVRSQQKIMPVQVIKRHGRMVCPDRGTAQAERSRPIKGKEDLVMDDR